MFKMAYTISELKPIVREVKAAIQSGALKEYTRGKYIPSSYSSTTGLVVNRRRSNLMPDRSIPDLLHEFSHFKRGHTPQKLGKGLAPSPKAIKQEFEATADALKFINNTKGIKRYEQGNYLINKFQKYKNAGTNYNL